MRNTAEVWSFAFWNLLLHEFHYLHSLQVVDSILMQVIGNTIFEDRIMLLSNSTLIEVSHSSIICYAISCLCLLEIDFQSLFGFVHILYIHPQLLCNLWWFQVLSNPQVHCLLLLLKLFQLTLPHLVLLGYKHVEWSCSCTCKRSWIWIIQLWIHWSQLAHYGCLSLIVE